MQNYLGGGNCIKIGNQCHLISNILIKVSKNIYKPEKSGFFIVCVLLVDKNWFEQKDFGFTRKIMPLLEELNKEKA